MEFVGKNVLVTGGTSGIGFATASAFLNRGAQLVISGSDQKRVSDAVERLGSKCHGVTADYMLPGAPGKVAVVCADKLGALDVMIPNAGICLTNNIENLDEDLFDKEMRINFASAILTVKHCLSLMRDKGSILFTTSVNDTIGVPGQLAYSASKAALRSAVRTLAAELAPRGIRVNAVAPGPIDTPIFDKFSSDPEVIANAKLYEAKLTALKRMGKPEEIADAFVYLAGSSAAYITAINLRVDGGWAEI